MVAIEPNRLRKGHFLPVFFLIVWLSPLLGKPVYPPNPSKFHPVAPLFRFPSGPSLGFFWTPLKNVLGLPLLGLVYKDKLELRTLEGSLEWTFSLNEVSPPHHFEWQNSPLGDYILISPVGQKGEKRWRIIHLGLKKFRYLLGPSTGGFSQPTLLDGGRVSWIKKDSTGLVTVFTQDFWGEEFLFERVWEISKFGSEFKPFPGGFSLGDPWGTLLGWLSPVGLENWGYFPHPKGFLQVGWQEFGIDPFQMRNTYYLTEFLQKDPYDHSLFHPKVSEFWGQKGGTWWVKKGAGFLESASWQPEGWSLGFLVGFKGDERLFLVHQRVHSELIKWKLLSYPNGAVTHENWTLQPKWATNREGNWVALKGDSEEILIYGWGGEKKPSEAPGGSRHPINLNHPWMNFILKANPPPNPLNQGVRGHHLFYFFNRLKEKGLFQMNLPPFFELVSESEFSFFKPVTRVVWVGFLSRLSHQLKPQTGHGKIPFGEELIKWGILKGESPHFKGDLEWDSFLEEGEKALIKWTESTHPPGRKK